MRSYINDSQNYENEVNFEFTGEGEETNKIIEQADRRDVDKPDVYFESNANEVEMGEEGGSKAEEVRLNGTSSRTHGGDLTDNEMAFNKNLKKANNPDEVEQTRRSPEKQTNSTSATKKEVQAADEKNSNLDADHSLANGPREVKGNNSKKGEKKKESKRLMSSPWILILTILFLFILACIILAVLR